MPVSLRAGTHVTQLGTFNEAGAPLDFFIQLYLLIKIIELFKAV